MFKLAFAKNTLLSCFFSFVLMIDFYFLIPAVITRSFNPTAALAIPTGIPTNVAKAEIETYPVNAVLKKNLKKF